MATCKDCLHVNLCKFKDLPAPLSDSYIRESECIEKRCGDFKGRSRFMELPCKVGDTVYFDNAHIQSARVLAIYIDAEGGMLDLEITAYSDNALGFKKFINKDYKFEDIGKHLFLKKEEAEQALKEREENA